MLKLLLVPPVGDSGERTKDRKTTASAPVQEATIVDAARSIRQRSSTPFSGKWSAPNCQCGGACATPTEAYAVLGSRTCDWCDLSQATESIARVAWARVGTSSRRPILFMSGAMVSIAFIKFIDARSFEPTVCFA